MSVSGIISAGKHAAFALQSSDSTASTELQQLFSKLHLDAVASFNDAATGATSSSATPASTTPSTQQAVTGLISGLRSLLDSGVSVASKGAKIAAKAAGAYATGNVAGIGAALLDKVA